MTSQRKAILKIKHANQNEHMIMASFNDSKGDDIKELIYMFWDSDSLELLFQLEKQLLKLGIWYDLFEAGKWKVLGQMGGRALKGHCKKYWNNIIKEAHNDGAGESNAQQKKFKKLIQKVNSKYLSKDAIKRQFNTMEYGKLKYNGHDYTSVM